MCPGARSLATRSGVSRLERTGLLSRSATTSTLQVGLQTCPISPFSNASLSILSAQAPMGLGGAFLFALYPYLFPWAKGTLAQSQEISSHGGEKLGGKMRIRRNL